MILNHYQLLDIDVNASIEEVRAAYDKKMKLKTAEGIMYEKYRTAYYVLSNPKRRYKYDISLGIHKYRNVSPVYRFLKGLARVFLTVLDGLFTFYWCLLLTIVVMVIIYYTYNHIPFVFGRFVKYYKEEIIILSCIAGYDLLLHFYVRRANRFLKHFNWEIKEEQSDELY